MTGPIWDEDDVHGEDLGLSTSAQLAGARDRIAELEREIARLHQHEAIRAQVIRERNEQRAQLEAALRNERSENERLRLLLEHAEQYARDLQDGPPG